MPKSAPDHVKNAAYKRRLALKTLSGSALAGALADRLPQVWQRPLVHTAVLPAHAQVSPGGGGGGGGRPRLPSGLPYPPMNLGFRVADLRTRTVYTTQTIEYVVYRNPITGQVTGVVFTQRRVVVQSQSPGGLVNALIPAAHAQAASTTGAPAEPALEVSEQVVRFDDETSNRENSEITLTVDGASTRFPVQILRDPAFIVSIPATLPPGATHPPPAALQDVSILPNAPAPAQQGEPYRADPLDSIGVYPTTGFKEEDPSDGRITDFTPPAVTTDWVEDTPLPSRASVRFAAAAYTVREGDVLSLRIDKVNASDLIRFDLLQDRSDSNLRHADVADVRINVSAISGARVDQDTSGQTTLIRIRDVVIPAGIRSVTIPITPERDQADPEPNESLVFNFAFLDTANIGEPASTVITIENRPAPLFSIWFEAEEYTLAEDGDVTVNIGHSIHTGNGPAVTVIVRGVRGSTAGHLDYKVSNPPATIPPDVQQLRLEIPVAAGSPPRGSTTNNARTLTIAGVRDLISPEPAETLILEFTADGEDIDRFSIPTPDAAAAGQYARTTIRITDVVPPVTRVEFTAASVEVAEGGTATIAVQVSGDADVSFDLIRTGGNAQSADLDLTSPVLPGGAVIDQASLNITGVNLNQPHSGNYEFLLPIAEDALRSEGTETLTYTIRNLATRTPGHRADTGNNPSITLRISNTLPDAINLPVVLEFGERTYNSREGQTTNVVIRRRTESPSFSGSSKATISSIPITVTNLAAEDFTVDLTALRNSAGAGAGFTFAGGFTNLEIPQDQATITLPIQWTEDNDNQRQSLQLRLDAANLTVENNVGISVAGNTSTTINVAQLPITSVQFSAGTYTGREGQDLIIRVNKTGGSAIIFDITLDHVTSQEEDLDLARLSNFTNLTIAADDRYRDITLPIALDNSVEGTQNFTLTLSRARGPSTGHSVALGSVRQATVNITDAPVTQVGFALDTQSVREGDSIDIRINKSGSSAITFDVVVPSTGNTAASTDYTPTFPQTITIPQGRSFHNLRLTATADAIETGDELLTLQLQSARDPSTGHAVNVDAGNSAIAITIVNVVPVVQFAGNNFSLLEGANAAAIRLSATPDAFGTFGDVVIRVTPSAGVTAADYTLDTNLTRRGSTNEYTLSETRLGINPVFDLTVNTDNVSGETNESILFELVDQAGYNLGTRSSIRVTLQDATAAPPPAAHTFTYTWYGLANAGGGLWTVQGSLTANAAQGATITESSTSITAHTLTVTRTGSFNSADDETYTVNVLTNTSTDSSGTTNTFNRSVDFAYRVGDEAFAANPNPANANQPTIIGGGAVVLVNSAGFWFLQATVAGGSTVTVAFSATAPDTNPGSPPALPTAPPDATTAMPRQMVGWTATSLTVVEPASGEPGGGANQRTTQSIRITRAGSGAAADVVFSIRNDGGATSATSGLRHRTRLNTSDLAIDNDTAPHELVTNNAATLTGGSTINQIRTDESNDDIYALDSAGNGFALYVYRDLEHPEDGEGITLTIIDRPDYTVDELNRTLTITFTSQALPDISWSTSNVYQATEPAAGAHSGAAGGYTEHTLSITRSLPSQGVDVYMDITNVNVTSGATHLAYADGVDVAIGSGLAARDNPAQNTRYRIVGTNTEFVLRIYRDELAEGPETFTLTLVDRDVYTISGTNPQTFTIVDNPPVGATTPAPQVIAWGSNAYSIEEPSAGPTPSAADENTFGFRTFTDLAITRAGGTDVDVFFMIEHGAGISAPARHDVFETGIDGRFIQISRRSGSTGHEYRLAANRTTFAIRVYRDNETEGDETMTLTLLSGPGYTFDTAGNNHKTVLTIRDNPPAPTVAPPPVAEPTTTEADNRQTIGWVGDTTNNGSLSFSVDEGTFGTEISVTRVGDGTAHDVVFSVTPIGGAIWAEQEAAANSDSDFGISNSSGGGELILRSENENLSDGTARNDLPGDQYAFRAANNGFRMHVYDQGGSPEAGEGVRFTLIPRDNYIVDPNRNVLTITFINNPPIVVSWSQSNFEGEEPAAGARNNTENTGWINYPVTITRTPNQDVDVRFRVTTSNANHASAGQHHWEADANVPLDFAITAGSNPVEDTPQNDLHELRGTATQFHVRVYRDQLAETDETLTLTLLTVEGRNYTLGSIPVATFTLKDNPPAGVTTAAPTIPPPAPTTTAELLQTVRWEQASYTITEPAAGPRSNTSTAGEYASEIIRVIRTAGTPAPITFTISVAGNLHRQTANTNNFTQYTAEADITITGTGLTSTSITAYRLDANASEVEVRLYRDLKTEPTSAVISFNILSNSGYIRGNPNFTEITLVDTPPVAAPTTTVAAGEPIPDGERWFEWTWGPVDQSVSLFSWSIVGEFRTTSGDTTLTGENVVYHTYQVRRGDSTAVDANQGGQATRFIIDVAGGTLRQPGASVLRSLTTQHSFSFDTTGTAFATTGTFDLSLEESAGDDVGFYRNNSGAYFLAARNEPDILVSGSSVAPVVRQKAHRNDGGVTDDLTPQPAPDPTTTPVITIPTTTEKVQVMGLEFTEQTYTATEGETLPIYFSFTSHSLAATGFGLNGVSPEDFTFRVRAVSGNNNAGADDFDYVEAEGTWAPDPNDGRLVALTYNGGNSGGGASLNDDDDVYFEITITDDMVAEGSENLVLEIVSGPHFTLGANTRTTITITDPTTAAPTPAPTTTQRVRVYGLEFTRSSETASEGGRVRIHFSYASHNLLENPGGAAEEFTFQVRAASSSTADAGDHQGANPGDFDYVRMEGTAEPDPNDGRLITLTYDGEDADTNASLNDRGDVWFEIDITDDQTPESDETLVLEIVPAPHFTLGTNTRTTITIAGLTTAAPTAAPIPTTTAEPTTTPVIAIPTTTAEPTTTRAPQVQGLEFQQTEYRATEGERLQIQLRRDTAVPANVSNGPQNPLNFQVRAVSPGAAADEDFDYVAATGTVIPDPNDGLLVNLSYRSSQLGDINFEIDLLADVLSEGQETLVLEIVPAPNFTLGNNTRTTVTLIDPTTTAEPTTTVATIPTTTAAARPMVQFAAPPAGGYTVAEGGTVNIEFEVSGFEYSRHPVQSNLGIGFVMRSVNADSSAVTDTDFAISPVGAGGEANDGSGTVSPFLQTDNSLLVEVSFRDNNADRRYTMLVAPNDYVADGEKTVVFEIDQNDTHEFIAWGGTNANPDGTNRNYSNADIIVGTRNRITITIEDAGLPTVGFSTSTISINEPETGAQTETIILAFNPPAASGNLDLNLRVTPSAGVTDADYDLPDFTASGNDFSLPQAQNGQFRIQVNADILGGEDNETITIELLPGTGYTVDSDNNSLEVTIVDSGITTPAPVVEFATNELNIIEPDTGTEATPISLNIATSVAGNVYFTVSGSATEPADYAFAGVHASTRANPQQGELEITDLNTFAISVTTDVLGSEGPETVILTLVDADNYDLGTNHELTITIADSGRTPTIQFSSPSLSIPEPDSGTTEQTISVDIDPAGSSVGTIYFSVGSGTATDPADYTLGGVENSTRGGAPTGEMQISSGNTFTISVKADTVGSEDGETVVLNLADADGYTLGNNDELTITIIDSGRLPQVTVGFSQSAYTGTEGGAVTEVVIQRGEGSGVSKVTLSLNVSVTNLAADDFSVATAGLGANPDFTTSLTSFTGIEIPQGVNDITIPFTWAADADTGTQEMTLTLVDANINTDDASTAIAAGNTTATITVAQIQNVGWTVGQGLSLTEPAAGPRSGRDVAAEYNPLTVSFDRIGGANNTVLFTASVTGITGDLTQYDAAGNTTQVLLTSQGLSYDSGTEQYTLAAANNQIEIRLYRNNAADNYGDLTLTLVNDPGYVVIEDNREITITLTDTPPQTVGWDAGQVLSVAEPAAGPRSGRDAAGEFSTLPVNLARTGANPRPVRFTASVTGITGDLTQYDAAGNTTQVLLTGTGLSYVSGNQYQLAAANQQFDIRLYRNNAAGGNQTLTLTLVDGDDYLVSTRDVTITLLDTPPQMVGWLNTGYEIIEPVSGPRSSTARQLGEFAEQVITLNRGTSGTNQPVTFKLTRSAGIQPPTDTNLLLYSDTADVRLFATEGLSSLGDDRYQLDERTSTFTVELYRDFETEATDETLTLTLENGENYLVDDAAHVTTITLKDNAPQAIAWERNSYSFTEPYGGDRDNTFTTNTVSITRAGGTDRPVDFEVSGSATHTLGDPDADVQILGATLRTGSTYTLATGTDITINVLRDPNKEGNEDLTLTLLQGDGYTIPDAPAHITTITLADNPPTTMPLTRIAFAESGYTVTEGENATLRVVKTGVSAVTFDIEITYGGGASEDDHGSLDLTGHTIPAGEGGELELTLPISTDTETPEAGETIIVTITRTYAPTDGHLLEIGDTAATTITITNVEPVTSITFASASETAREGEVVTLRVNKSGPAEIEFGITLTAGQAADIAQATAGGTEITFGSGSITIPAEEGGVDIEITLATDTLIEGNETLTFTLGTIIANPGHQVGPTAISTATITIIDVTTTAALAEPTTTLPVTRIFFAEPAYQGLEGEEVTLRIEKQGDSAVTYSLRIDYGNGATQDDIDLFGVNDRTIAAGDSHTELTLPLVTDTETPEDGETLIITITRVEATTDGHLAQIGAQNSTEITIINVTPIPTTAEPTTIPPEPQMIGWAQNEYRVQEPLAGPSNAGQRTQQAISITRAGGTAGNVPVKVQITTSSGVAVNPRGRNAYDDGVDFVIDGLGYISQDQNAEFTISRNRTSFNLLVYRDEEAEAEETITLTLVEGANYTFDTTNNNHITTLTLVDNTPTTTAELPVAVLFSGTGYDFTLDNAVGESVANMRVDLDTSPLTTGFTDFVFAVTDTNGAAVTYQQLTTSGISPAGVVNVQSVNTVGDNFGLRADRSLVFRVNLTATVADSGTPITLSHFPLTFTLLANTGYQVGSPNSFTLTVAPVMVIPTSTLPVAGAQAIGWAQPAYTFAEPAGGPYGSGEDAYMDAQVVLTRTAGTAAAVVFEVGGSAGVTHLTGTNADVQIIGADLIGANPVTGADQYQVAASEADSTITLRIQRDPDEDDRETVTLTLIAGDGYTINTDGGNHITTITIADTTPAVEAGPPPTEYVYSAVIGNLEVEGTIVVQPNTALGTVLEDAHSDSTGTDQSLDRIVSHTVVLYGYSAGQRQAEVVRESVFDRVSHFRYTLGQPTFDEGFVPHRAGAADFRIVLRSYQTSEMFLRYTGANNTNAVANTWYISYKPASAPEPVTQSVAGFNSLTFAEVSTGPQPLPASVIVGFEGTENNVNQGNTVQYIGVESLGMPSGITVRIQRAAGSLVDDTAFNFVLADGDGNSTLNNTSPKHLDLHVATPDDEFGSTSFRLETLPATPDNSATGPEYLILEVIPDPSGNNAYTTNFARRFYTIEIRPPTAVEFASAEYAVDEIDGATLEVMVNKVGASQARVEVSLVEGDSSDIRSISPQTLEFAAGDTQKTLTLTVGEDRSSATDKTVILELTLTDPVIADTGHFVEIGDQGRTTITVRNTIGDGPLTTIQFDRATASADEGRDVTLTVTKSGISAVTFDISVSNPESLGNPSEADDITLPTLTGYSIPSGEGGSTTITIPLTSDTDATEGPERFIVRLINIDGADDGHRVGPGTQDDITVTINDVDPNATTPGRYKWVWEPGTVVTAGAATTYTSIGGAAVPAYTVGATIRVEGVFQVSAGSQSQETISASDLDSHVITIYQNDVPFYIMDMIGSENGGTPTLTLPDGRKTTRNPRDTNPVLTSHKFRFRQDVDGNGLDEAFNDVSDRANDGTLDPPRPTFGDAEGVVDQEGNTNFRMARVIIDQQGTATGLGTASGNINHWRLRDGGDNIIVQSGNTGNVSTVSGRRANAQKRPKIEKA